MYLDPVTPAAVDGSGHRIAMRIDRSKVVDGGFSTTRCQTLRPVVMSVASTLGMKSVLVTAQGQPSVTDAHWRR